MAAESLGIFFVIKKFADSIGLTDYVKKFPEKALDVIYEKIVQDNPKLRDFWKILFKDDLRKIFDETFEEIAPKNETVKRRFILAAGTDPNLNEICADIEKGRLPKAEQLTLTFSKILPSENPTVTAEKFIRILFKGIKLDEKQNWRIDLSHSNKLDELLNNTTQILEHLEQPLPPGTQFIIKEGHPASEGILISTASLPNTGPELFGRDTQLEILDRAWENENTNVISLAAFGGVGKSALVNVWLNKLAQDHYRGAQRVYGHSFYSQGTREDKQASADPFIAAALEWFGDPDPTAGSPWQKGERLAALVREQRTLLILDGAEPLQYPPGEMGGRLRDPGMQSLVRGLARHNPGLCVVTTRLAVEDLKTCEGTLAECIDLEQLSPEAGARLLKARGVTGSDKELREASEEFDGHALALNLLSNYLSVVHDGDIRKRDQIAKLTKNPKQGGHARRVMESYEGMFADKPELDVLHMMGLFDRPAEGGAIEALKAEPAIEGLTSRVTALSYDDWQIALHNLREAKLLAEKVKGEPDTLDCHPLIREHFGEKLNSENPDAWKEAHRRLYEYYKNSAKEYPDSIEEMIPLYAAVAHGCQAEMHQETLDGVYWRRIQRGKEAFNIHKLGAIGAELAVLSNFFDLPWERVTNNISDAAKGYIFGVAGYDIRAQGRLKEATLTMREGLKFHIKLKDWNNGSIQAINLSELYLTLGKVEKALEYAEQSFEYADKSGDEFQMMISRTTLADALHQAGNFNEAVTKFREAEEIEKKRQPEYPLLSSFAGFQYCDLLLEQIKYLDVLHRADKLFEWRLPSDSLLDIAINNLSFGRASIMQIQYEKKTDFIKAETHLDEAVDGLREAGRQDFIPRGLLARAELYRVKKEYDNAERDLEEAMEIATLGSMRLHEAGCHLGYARLYLAKGEKDEARGHLSIAKEMIEDMGYHRRDGEVRELEGELGEE